MQATAGGRQTRRLLLRGGAGAVTRCRDFTRKALADWQWIPAPKDRQAEEREHERERDEDGRERDEDERERLRERVEDVLLLVSEVVSNACLHAGGPSELVLSHGAEGLLIEVSDRSPDRPVLRPRGDPALPGGHGLMVLERLSRSWGWRPAATGRTGKTVWLEVPLPWPPPHGAGDHGTGDEGR
ncbi:ATP-binding protein [Streptomyces sp. NPDC001581]|uniref:ATP-binding protein n=1 Tax=Streptomyces sp. NPDC001581 TaxID=3154386 RepID=UPI00332EC453